eukprot:m.307153 g.307153  ORF g.307153 m.307153 type:complete len:339 (-) comp20191_c1_seq81:3949-4965(-)
MSKRSSRSDLKYGKYNQTTSRSRTTPETTPGQGAFTMGSRHIRRGRQRQPIPSVEIRHPCRRNIIHRQIHIQWTHNNIQQRKCQTRQEKSIFSSSTICANRPNATNVLRTPSTRRWQGPTRSSYSNIPYTIHKPITIRDRKKVSTQPHRYRPQHLHTPRRNIRNPRDLQRVQIKPRPTHYRSRRSQQTATTITRCIRIHHDSIHGRLTDRLHPRKNNRSERRFTPRRDHQSVLHPRTYHHTSTPQPLSRQICYKFLHSSCFDETCQRIHDFRLKQNLSAITKAAMKSAGTQRKRRRMNCVTHTNPTPPNDNDLDPDTIIAIGDNIAQDLTDTTDSESD